jgi:hypothetical protein
VKQEVSKKNRNQRGTQIEYSLPEKASWESGFARQPTNTANGSFLCPLVKRWEEGEHRQIGTQTWTESTARIAGSRRKGTNRFSLVKPFSKMKKHNLFLLFKQKRNAWNFTFLYLSLFLFIISFYFTYLLFFVKYFLLLFLYSIKKYCILFSLF